MINHEFQQRYEKDSKEEIYSKVVRAGKRTYFFDVKETMNKDPYIVITESKRKTDNSGKIQFDKHKIYLYKEDLVTFTQGLSDIIDYIRSSKPELFNEDGTAIDAYLQSSSSSIDAEFDSL